MTLDRQTLSLFTELVDLPRAERTARLAQLPPELRAAVLALLAADGHDDDLPDVIDALVVDIASTATPKAPPELPDTLGGYRIGPVLGAGGMGVVYRARQTSPHRDVAIKVLWPDQRMLGGRARILAEAQALADVHHPTVPAVIEVAADAEFDFIAMALVQGHPLHTWALGRSTRDIVILLQRVAEGLQAAHDAGVLHCDVKPDNILVDDADQPHLIDFGLSRAPASTRPGSAGTLPYLADEVLAGAAPTTQSDLFALGVVAWEALAGGRPWTASTRTLAQESLARRAARERGLTPHRPLDRVLLGVLTQAIDADPSRRYARVADFARDLDAWRRHLPTDASPPGLAGRGLLWLRRHPATGAILGALAAVALVASLVHWQRQSAQALAATAVVDATLAEARTLATPEARHTMFAVRTSAAAVAGSEQVPRGWLTLADLDREDADISHETEALARAWSMTTDPGLRAHVAERLAVRFEASHRYDALDRLQVGQPDTAAWRRVRQRVSAAQGNFAAAVAADPASPLSRLLGALQGARRYDHRPVWLRHFEGPSTTMAWMQTDPPLVVMASAERDMPVVRETPFDMASAGFGLPLLLGPDGRWMVARAAAAWEHLAVYRVAPDGSTTLVHTLPAGGPVLAFALGDPDGDGVTTLYWGTAGNDRSVRMVRLVDGTSRTTPDHEIAVASDVTHLHLVDLDGDGRDELVAALSSWNDYAVRAWQLQDDVHPRDPVDFKASGTPVTTVLTEAGAPPRLLVVDTQQHPPNTPLFGTPPHNLDEALHVLSLDRGAWVSHLTLPITRQTHGTAGDPLAADLDGDGRAELTWRNEHGTTVHTVGTDGTWTTLDLEDVFVLDAMQLDDDPALEALVRMPRDDHHLWVLGLGDGDVLRGASAMPSPSTSLPEGLTVDTRRMVRLGLIQLAIETQRLATAASTGLEQARRRVALAHLLEADERPEEALAVLLEANEPPTTAQQAAITRLRAATHRETDARVDRIDLTDPSRGVSQIVHPTAASWDTERGLTLRAAPVDGVLWAMPVDVEGDRLGIEAAFTVRSAEQGAHLDLELVDAAGERIARLGLRPWGGNQAVSREVVFQRGAMVASDSTNLDANIDWTEEVRIRLHQRGREVLCSLMRDGREIFRFASQASPPAEGPATLRLRTLWPLTGAGSVLLDASLHTLWLEGLTPRQAAPPPPPPVADLAAQAMAAHDQADEPMVRTLLAPLASSDDPTVAIALAAELRREPTVWSDLLRRHLPQLHDRVSVLAWTAAMDSAASVDADQSTVLPGLDRIAPTDLTSRHFLRRRAEALVRVGETRRALAVLRHLAKAADGPESGAFLARVALARWADQQGDAVDRQRWCDQAGDLLRIDHPEQAAVRAGQHAEVCGQP